MPQPGDRGDRLGGAATQQVMGSQQGLAQWEDVCFALPSSFCLFQGGSASLFSGHVPWHLPHCFQWDPSLPLDPKV